MTTRSCWRVVLVCCVMNAWCQAQGGHPRLLLSRTDVEAMRAHRSGHSLFAETVQRAQRTIDSALACPVDVPVPKDAAAYTHERHKQNAKEMMLAGILYQVMQEDRYAVFVRDMLLKYAALYPTLKIHPAAINDGGKLFWQSLNETVWLVQTSQAYDCVFERLTAAERSTIEANILRPVAKFFMKERAETIDRIHNHGTWMIAAVGMLGYVLDDREMVDIALRGTRKDGKSGFLRQLDLLFSPDGYYSEGPYYARYALTPFFVFAEAIERNQPDLRIFSYRNGILGKTLESVLQLSAPDGSLIPVNDALDKSIRSQDLVFVLDHTYVRYGNRDELLAVAKEQATVSLDAAGLAVSRAFELQAPGAFGFRSVEMTDGAAGDEGGIGVLRSGPPEDRSMIVLKYTAQGGGHGHYDKLNFVYYDQNRPIVRDYGSARFVNVEEKFGGRYLRENESWAKQTIAHNTVTVDGVSHYGGVYKVAQKRHADRHFFSAEDPQCQVVSAKVADVVPGVTMQRTIALVRDARLGHPVVLDVVRIDADAVHQYDVPVYYVGQFIHTNVRYAPQDKRQEPLGQANGYQHLWNEAEGEADGTVSFTWLNGSRFYSILSSTDTTARVFFVRSGANDPEFNLRSEPGVIIRRNATTTAFASIIQPHGLFEAENEISRGSAPVFERVTVLGTNTDGTVVEFTGKEGTRWVFAVAHGPASTTAVHTVSTSRGTLTWTGNFDLRN